MKYSCGSCKSVFEVTGIKESIVTCGKCGVRNSLVKEANQYSGDPGEPIGSEAQWMPIICKKLKAVIGKDVPAKFKTFLTKRIYDLLEEEYTLRDLKAMDPEELLDYVDWQDEDEKSFARMLRSYGITNLTTCDYDELTEYLTV